MKNSFSLLEIIFSLLITSFIIINSLTFLKESYFINKDIQEREILKIDLLATKVFLQKNAKDIEKYLKLETSILYYRDSILLQDISNFGIEKKDKYFEINIQIKDEISQVWKIQK